MTILRLASLAQDLRSLGMTGTAANAHPSIRQEMPMEEPKTSLTRRAFCASAAAAAALAALHASGGVPTVRGTLTVGGDHDDAVAEARNLRRAIRLSILAVCLAGVVCLLSWFSPRKADSPSSSRCRPGLAPSAGR